MWAKKIIAITDSKECEEDFLKRVEKLARAKIDTLILREKHLNEALYYDLAKEVLKICAKYKLTCFLHNFDKVALKLNHKFFHCPFDTLDKEPRLAKYFHIIGTSIHHEDQLKRAVELKCNYAIYGHIFESSCKPFLEPKGIEKLQKLSEKSPIALYAIGGINKDNAYLFANIDIQGICLRSALMKERDLNSYINTLRKNLL